MPTQEKPQKISKYCQVERLLLSVIHAERQAERRQDERIDTSIVVAVVPCHEGRPLPDASFATMTKNISSSGISLIVNRSLPEAELFIGFPGKSELSFVRATVLYREPLPLGCYKLGLLMDEVVSVDDWPELKNVVCYRPGA
ncbi:MAG TPA: PilZ domain-containing protein [Pirellulales bacterium]